MKSTTRTFFKTLHKVLLFSMLSLTAGCLTTSGGGSTSSEEPSAISNADFAGATSAANKGGPIQISWTLPSASVSGFRIYRVGGGGELTNIAFAKSTDTSYIDSNTTFGQLYSYVVRAVDTAGIEEKNTKRVTSISYPGLFEVTITGKTTATLGLIPSVGAIDEVKVYAQAQGTTTKVELATLTPNQTSVDVTGLRNGTKYNFSAQARNIELDLYDGNENVLSATTDSLSFSGFSTGEYVYRGFMTVKAYGNAPGAATDPLNANRIPKTRKVILIAPPFQGYTSRDYKIVRIAADQGQTLDINTTEVCTDTTISSCIPCGEIVSVTLDAKSESRIYCEDTAVGAPPAKYQYAISMYDTNGTETWLEQLPTTYEPFLTTVHIPPDNMVLTHRDSVNYDMCKVMGRESDPKNHQRCLYAGMGATTYSSGPEKPPLNLEPYYYDFGYNLFVDRWEAACNWTKASSGGMCGPGGAAGDCIGKVASSGGGVKPDNALGVNGNIYFVANYHASGWNACFIKKGGVWDTITNAVLTAQETQDIITNDPSAQGGHRPAIMYVSRARAQELCQAKSDVVYGNKRLPRLREARAYSPLPWLPGESDRSENVSVIEDATLGFTGGATPYSCNTRSYINGSFTPTLSTTALPNTGFLVPASFTKTLADMLLPGWDFANYGFSADASNKLITNNTSGGDNSTFFIGSLRTSDCVSRFGVQDAIGNINEYVSDKGLWVNISPYYWSFVAPSDDPLNTDLVGFKFNGTMGVASPQVSDTWTPAVSLNNPGVYTYFTAPLGLPRKDSDSSEATPTAIIPHNFDQFNVASPRGNVTDANQVGNIGVGGDIDGSSAGRWKFEIQESSDFGFRCVLPAE